MPPTGLAALEASFDRILSLEEQTGTARTAVHEALLNLLQSRAELSTSGAMLSAATRAAMGKRGIAQLETSKGLLDNVADAAAEVRGDAATLRDEVRAALHARDEAVEAAAAAEMTRQETIERVEADGTAHVLASNEVAERARQEAAAALVRAEAAELRAEQAERGFTEAEKARAQAAAALGEANATRDAATGRLELVEAQLGREREASLSRHGPDLTPAAPRPPPKLTPSSNSQRPTAPPPTTYCKLHYPPGRGRRSSRA